MSSHSIKVLLGGVEFDVSFDFQPEEKEVRYYSDGSGYPGCSAEIEITNIEYEGEDWNDYLSDKAEKILEETLWYILEHHEY